MGCESSQLLQNLPNDRETVEKTSMMLDKVRNVPKEDKENRQKIKEPLKLDGNRTIRKEKTNIAHGSQEINQQTFIHRQPTIRANGYNSNTRDGSGLSKFAVPRNRQLPNQNKTRMENSQQNIQVEQNQTSLFGQLKEGDKVEDLMAGIVLDKAAHIQKDGFYENCQRQCISQEIKTEEMGENHTFSVLVELQQQQPQESQTPKLREQIEGKVQIENLQCLSSRLLPNMDHTSNNPWIQVHQLGVNQALSKHSISSSKSFEPLIIVLTQKGETFNQEY